MSGEKRNLGVIGLNALQVAKSAESAGFNVFLVDYHMDSDVLDGKHFPLQKNPLNPNLGKDYSAAKLVDYAIKKLSGLADDILLTSAVGCNPPLVRELEEEFNVVGNGFGAVSRARNWHMLEEIASNAGCRVPETVPVESRAELVDALEETGFPAVLKPCFEGSGFHQRILHRIEDLEFIEEFYDGMLVQKKIDGIPLSCSVLSDGTDAISLTVNRQLVGLREFNAKEFTYCGNIIPYETPYQEEIKNFSREIVSSLGLVGCNGVDYILKGSEIYLLEVNSRIPDTLWGVERRLGINLVKEHVSAVDGRMTPVFRENNGFYGKAILFSDKQLKVESKIDLEGVGNIPPEGTLIQVNEPICCLYSKGRNDASVLEGLINKAREVIGRHLIPS
ncbi:MAG: hypothetical protein B6U72_06685 [Candidatus Altiarchaeales archaeon ex4484_2]|nr:MAG: hypothetical protein B6U72_06685 [Candidatus Altiarchaeales archaeon ex4484_2]